MIQFTIWKFRITVEWEWDATDSAIGNTAKAWGRRDRITGGKPVSPVQGSKPGKRVKVPPKKPVK